MGISIVIVLNLGKYNLFDDGFGKYGYCFSDLIDGFNGCIYLLFVFVRFVDCKWVFDDIVFFI